ncbi:MAG: hypothetical protein ACR2MC_03410 [Actinomycetota bacterium]
MSETPSDEAAQGSWPSPLRQFLWDVFLKSKAPENSGIRIPKFESPDWLSDELVQSDDTLEAARSEHQEGAGRAKIAEEKAERLMQTSLALLALAIAVGGFQVSYARDETTGWLPLVLLMPTVLSIAFLVIAGIEALEINRVGMYWPPVTADLVGDGIVRRKLIEAELRGSVIADWTAKHKVNALLQARAWFSRGLVLLLLAALISIGMVWRGSSIADQGTPRRHSEKLHEQEPRGHRCVWVRGPA